MHNPEDGSNKISRKSQLTSRIEELRKIKIVNQSDPEYAAEIQDEIDQLEVELQNLEA
jgi:protein-arginine kinase activator protein McsA